MGGTRGGQEGSLAHSPAHSTESKERGANAGGARRQAWRGTRRTSRGGHTRPHAAREARSRWTQTRRARACGCVCVCWLCSLPLPLRQPHASLTRSSRSGGTTHAEAEAPAKEGRRRREGPTRTQQDEGMIMMVGSSPSHRLTLGAYMDPDFAGTTARRRRFNRVCYTCIKPRAQWGKRATGHVRQATPASPSLSSSSTAPSGSCG